MLGASTDSRPSDRRQHSRKVIPFPVSLLLGSEGQGRLIDLSEGGMSVQGTMPPSLTPGARLRIQLSNDSTPIELGCELVWAEASGKSGMRFLIMSETSKQELQRLLSRAPGSNLPMSSPMAEGARTTGTQTTAQIADQLQRDIPTEAGIGPREEEMPSVAPVRESGLPARAAGDPALTFLTERACKLAQADGAAIALLEGASFFCRAITGMAPPCGTQIQANSALSAECLRTGQLVRCDDVAMDPRVDPELYRRLNLRSVIVVPIHSGEDIIGLLEMFSTQAHAFDSLDLLSLRLIAESAGAVVSSDSRSAIPALSALSALSFSVTPPRAAAEPKPAPNTRTIIPGILVCDVCGCENSIERVHVCRECDVPLPTAPEIHSPVFTAEILTECNPASSHEDPDTGRKAKKSLASYGKTYLAALLFGVLLLPVLRYWRGPHWGEALSSVQASEAPPYPVGAHAMRVMDAKPDSTLAAAPVIMRAGAEDENLKAKTTPRVALPSDYAASLDTYIASPGDHVASPDTYVASPGDHVAPLRRRVAPPSYRLRSSSRVPQRDFLTSTGSQRHTGGTASSAALELAAQIPSQRAGGILALAPVPRLATQPAKTNEGLWKKVTGMFSRNSHHSHPAEAKSDR
jgi:putative methionine-R-sulfoxide reductase with GAF domain